MNQLRLRHKWQATTNNIVVRQMVLTREDKPPVQWPLAYPGLFSARNVVVKVMQLSTVMQNLGSFAVVKNTLAPIWPVIAQRKSL